MKTERRLLGYLRPYRGLFLLGLLATAVSSVLDGFTIVVLIPLFKHLFGTAGALTTGASRLEAFMDRLLAPVLAGTTSGEAAGRIVLVLMAGLLLKNTTGYAASQISVRIQEGLVRDLRTEVFDHLLALDLDFFQRTRGGQLIARLITDVELSKTAVSAALASFFQNLVVIVTTLVVLQQISWRLTLLTVAMVPILLLGIQALLRRLRRYSRERAEEMGEITATVAERLGAIRLIRAYGGETREGRRFREQADRYRKRVIRAQRFSSLTSPVSEVFGGAVLILLIWAGTQPAVTGVLVSPQVLIVFLVAALKMMAPLKSITQFPNVMAIALASAERVFEVLDRPALEAELETGRLARFEREVVFDEVSFHYGDEPEVLRKVSLTLPRGRVVALVGPSGAGKTTLADLLTRFQEPTQGRILLDGVPLPEFSRRSLRDLLGVVGQETLLLNDTVRANISYGRPGAGPQEVEQAARAANAHEFIRALPQGYDTTLGERGTRLSGGERQRIAIARALLKDPPILILDEATSALDTESERLVQQAIDRLMRERTVLVIAHRLATVRHADEIVVLEAGCIVERGTHEQLLLLDGLYRRLHDLQFRATVSSTEY